MQNLFPGWYKNPLRCQHPFTHRNITLEHVVTAPDMLPVIQVVSNDGLGTSGIQYAVKHTQQVVQFSRDEIEIVLP